MRNHLISIDSENEQNLLEIQKAVSVLVLDERQPLTMAEVLLINYLYSTIFTSYFIMFENATLPGSGILHDVC